MRLTFFLLFITCMHASANSFSQKVTIDANNAHLKSIFNQINVQSGYTFFYSETDLKSMRKVTLHAKDEDVVDVIKRVFQGQPFEYSIIGKTVAIRRAVVAPRSLKPAEMAGDVAVKSIDKVITGKVTGQAGQPLEGVSVTVRGTDRGTTTDQNGNYVLNVRQDDKVLEFSMVGFGTEQRAIDGAVINVSLGQAASDLSEVVIVGYGTQQRGNLTGATTVVNTKLLQDRPVSNVSNLLQGSVPNLEVNFRPADRGQAAA